jgi:metal-responsive CopG/Arc/MetJ family transcriptional regulator
METIQIVIDSKLRQAVDRAAKRRKVNRSALAREALRAHLKTMRIQELEERDRKGYEAPPETEEELTFGQGETAWLED